MSNISKLMMQAASGASGGSVDAFVYYFADTDIQSVRGMLADSSGNHYALCSRPSSGGHILLKVDGSGTVVGTTTGSQDITWNKAFMALSPDESEILYLPLQVVLGGFDTLTATNNYWKYINTSAYYGGSFGGDPLYSGTSPVVSSQAYSTSVSTSWTNPHVTKLNSDLTFNSRKFLCPNGQTSYDGPYGNAAASDASGNMYVYTPVPSQSVGAIWKLDTTCTPVWAISSSFTHVYYSLDADSDGNVYIAYHDSTYLYVEKFNSSGVSQWRKGYTNFGTGTNVPKSSRVIGDHYVIASEYNPGVKLLSVSTSDGTPEWHLRLHDQTSGADTLYSKMYVGLYKHPTENGLTISTGRMGIQLPVDGSVTGVYALTGGNLTISSLTLPTPSSFSTPFSTYAGYTRDDTTFLSSNSSTTTSVITDPIATDL